MQRYALFLNWQYFLQKNFSKTSFFSCFTLFGGQFRPFFALISGSSVQIHSNIFSSNDRRAASEKLIVTRWLASFAFPGMVGISRVAMTLHPRLRALGLKPSAFNLSGWIPQPPRHKKTQIYTPTAHNTFCCHYSVQITLCFTVICNNGNF